MQSEGTRAVPFAAMVDGGRVIEPRRELPVAAEVDVLVAGGGPAGLGAAVAAAREGANTLLIEQNAFLGGVATATKMAMFMSSRENMSGLTGELVDRLVARGGADVGTLTSFDVESFKEVALELVEESGARLLLYTSVVAPIMAGNVARGVVVENKSGRQAILAKVVIDCTGDADVAYRAGVPCVLGREKDGKTRPITLLFRLGGVDVRKVVEFARAHPEDFTPDPRRHVLDLEDGLVRISGFFQEVKAARERGELDKDCHYVRLEGVQVERGMLYVNTTRVYGLDGSNAWDLTRAELEARKQMRQLLPFLKREIPGLENAFVVETSTHIGVRETRRIRGEYVFDEGDVVAGRTWEDTILGLKRRHKPGDAMHSPDAGEGADTDDHNRQMGTPLVPFEVPYRSLVPLEVDGLLVAGRSISQTHSGDMYTRGMYTCILLGQAAGVGAAISLRQGVRPREADRLTVQKALVRQGVRLGRQQERVEAALS